MLLALLDNVHDSLYHQVGKEEQELDDLDSGSYGLSTPQGLKLNPDLTGRVLHHLELEVELPDRALHHLEGFPVRVNKQREVVEVSELLKGVEDYFDVDLFCGPMVVVNI